ncbi:MAG TPA: hypothetical protein VJV78_20125, partial [Polyangiales bacterium]|nr:hypothetical protein [Polyangiales bacterium]
SMLSGYLSVHVQGDDDWWGRFVPVKGVSRLAPGYYAGMHEPSRNPVRAGFEWGCNAVSGWFVVDSVTYDADILTAIDLRFEQHCDLKAAALRGQIHWRADDPTIPAGPVNPAPEELWRPPGGATPASGSYCYLQSDAGDFIGAGQTLLYTGASVHITADESWIQVQLADWHGDFVAMQAHTLLELGYFGNARRAVVGNPTRPGLSWSGQGRGCNTTAGWFVIDKLSFDGQVLTALDLRFEQHCEGEGPALRGAVHWGAP